VSCTPLASTGSPVLATIGIGGVLLAAGVLLVLLTRARDGRSAATVMLLLLVIGGGLVGLLASGSASAATSDCASSTIPGGAVGSPSPAGADSLSITQTSTITGLGPEIAPVPITGTITYVGTASALVTAVTVHIASVTRAPSTLGSCDASDYVLLDPDMPVGATLTPGQSAPFTGARIGFNDKTVNQDACQNARLTLSYVSS
jgi:hypothetical protein